MAVDYGPQGTAGDQVSCKAKVDDADLGPGNRTDLRFTVARVSGPATVVDVVMVLVNWPGGTATVEPPGIAVPPASIAAKTGIPLGTNVETEIHFLIDNPATGLAPAQYHILPTVRWTTDGPFPLGPSLHSDLG